MCLCWVYNFMILLYRNSTTKNISQNHKIVHLWYKHFSLVLFLLVVVHIVIYCAALPYWSNKACFLVVIVVWWYLLLYGFCMVLYLCFLSFIVAIWYQRKYINDLLSYQHPQKAYNIGRYIWGVFFCLCSCCCIVFYLLVVVE